MGDGINNSFSSWTAIIPIVNLDLKIPSIQIGQVSIKICTEDTFNDFKRIIKENKDIGDDIKQEMTSWPERFYIGQIVAECQVQAVDSEHAGLTPPHPHSHNLLSTVSVSSTTATVLLDNKT